MGPFLTTQATSQVSDQVAVFNSVVTSSETLDVAQRTSVVDAIDALLDIGADGASHMGNLLRDPESKVFTKLMLCDVLARLRGDGIGALEDLFAAVAEERDHVREEAARAINWIAMDPTAQAQAAQLLQQGLSTTLPLLKSALTASDPRARASSARALARLAPFMTTIQKGDMVPPLVNLINDAYSFNFRSYFDHVNRPSTDFYMVRDAALWALEQFGPEVPATRDELNNYYFQRLKEQIDLTLPGLEDLAAAAHDDDADTTLRLFKEHIITRLFVGSFEEPSIWASAGSADELLTNYHTRNPYAPPSTTRYVGAPGAMDWLVNEPKNWSWGEQTSRMAWSGSLLHWGGFRDNADPKYLRHWLGIWSDFDSNFLNQLILAEDHYQAFGYWPSTGRLASSGWRWPLHVAYRLEARIHGIAAAAKRAPVVLDEVIEDFLLAKLLLTASNEIELLIPWLTDPNTQAIYNVPANQMQHSATAMVQALATLLDFKSAGKWSNALNTYVDDFMPYYPDGTEGEQSFHYNENFLKLARSSIKLISFGSGMSFVDSLPHKGLYRYRFLSSIVRPNDGLTPGEGMANAPLYTEYQEVFNDPLVGKIINMTQNQTGPAPAFESIMFPWSGYHVLRNGWNKNDTHLYLKGGRKGVGHKSASGNAIQLTAHGRTILTRGGRRSYGAGPFPGHNEYQLSSFGYNTIVVDGKSQRNEAAPIQPDPIPARWHSSDLLDVAESRYESGYVSIEEPIVHSRQVVFVRDLNVFVVTDRISSQNQRQYSQIWKFDRAYSNDQVQGNDGAQILRTLDPTGPNVTLHHFSATPLTYRKYYGQQTPRVLGWEGVEPHYAAVDIHADWQGTGAQQVVTLLRPTPNLESTLPQVQKIGPDGVDGFAMSDGEGGQLKYWSVATGSSLLGEDARIRVMGEALLIRENENGDFHGFAIGVDELHINGQSHPIEIRDFSFRSLGGQLILLPIRSPERFEWVDTAEGTVPSYWTSNAKETIYDLDAPHQPGTFIWNNSVNGNASGSWAEQANWTGASRPTTTNDTADFSTLNLTANSVISLNGNQEINKLLFADATTPSHDWSLAPGSPSTSTLTLGGNAPEISVTNRTVTLSAKLAGSANWTKTGAGTLRLTNATNSFTGDVTVQTGVLDAQRGALGTTAGRTYINSTGSTTTGGQLQINGNGVLFNEEEPVVIQGAGNNASGAGAAALRFGGGAGSATTWSNMNGAITLDGNANYKIEVYLQPSHWKINGDIARSEDTTGTLFVDLSHWQQTTPVRLTINSAIKNNGGALMLLGNTAGILQMDVAGHDIGDFTINGAYNLSPTNYETILKLGISNALAITRNLTITKGTFDLAGYNQAVNALNGVLNASLITNSGDSASKLTIGNGGGSGTFSGIISDGAAAISVEKTGSGTQTLAGTNNYSGDTTVSGGTLVVTGGHAISDSGRLIIHSGAKVDPSGSTETVGTLFFGSVQQTAGTWGSSASTATNKNDTYFTGTGVIQVTSGPPVTYTVTYDANGATSGSVPAAQTKTQGVALTLAANTGSLVKTGYSFAGWNTAANGAGTDYAVNNSYTTDAPLTLYAIWIPLAPTTPGIKTIQFTGAEGYEDGPLISQNGWTGATQWYVDNSGGGSARLSADGFQTLTRAGNPGATLNLAVGESVTLRTVIQLSGNLIAPLANEPIMNLGIGTSAIPGSFVRLYLTTDGNITLYNSDVKNGVRFPIAGNSNARLAIDTTYTVGDGNWGSTTTHELINLDTNTSAGTGTRVWGEAVPAIWNLITGTDAVDSFCQTTWSSSRTGIQSITLLSTQYVAVATARYGSWADRMGLTGAMAEPDADPMGVGISNLLRYAFGMDISNMQLDRLPQLRMFKGQSGMPSRPGISFYAKNTDDINFVVEVSPDLQNWSALPHSKLSWEEYPTSDYRLRYIEVRDLEATAKQQPNRFYRLRLQKKVLE